MKDIIFNTFYAISAILVLIGAYLKLTYNEFGSSILFLGLIIGGLASVLYISHLKKKIQTLEEEKKQLEHQIRK